MSEISGGITNILWKLQPESKTLDPVVVRIFGEQTDKIIDREHEQRVLSPLNSAGFGAKVLINLLPVIDCFCSHKICHRTHSVKKPHAEFNGHKAANVLVSAHALLLPSSSALTLCKQ